MSKYLKNPQKAKEPRTVGVESVQRLASVFGLPTQEQADARANQKYARDAEGFRSESGYYAPYDDKEAPEAPESQPCVRELCEPTHEVCGEDATCNQVETPRAPVLDALAEYEAGELERAHELEQFKLKQQYERNRDLHIITLSIQDFINAGGVPEEWPAFHQGILEEQYVILADVLNHVA